MAFRGTVLPTQRRPLSARTCDLFGVEFEVPTLDPAELYASKQVAALDRQHPRDLFDIWRLFETDGITDAMVECFMSTPNNCKRCAGSWRTWSPFRNVGPPIFSHRPMHWIED